MDKVIINAWEHWRVGEDDDAYEGRINLESPNDVAAAYEHEVQCAAVVGAALENFPPQNQKNSSKLHICQKKEKERTRNEQTTSQISRAPSPNCQFSISKHQAEINVRVSIMR
jgi:hypothetical protein